MARRRDSAEKRAWQLRREWQDAQRSARAARMAYYRRTGRVVLVIPEAAADDLLAELPADTAVPPHPSPALRRRWWDRALLLVEVLALAGLVWALFNSFSLLGTLNAEVAAALQPALTPTPLVRAVVLPGGHTPPTAPGGARPNEAEIPEHLRPYAQAYQAALSIPTPGPEQAIRIQIPAIGVDAPIVMGDGWEQLKKGVGQHPGTANPGQPGNMVLSAHNDIYGEIFRDLDQLQPGDTILIHTRHRIYTYVVTEVHVVEPTDVQWLAPTQEPTLTLISCYPYLVDNQRIVVRARLASDR